MKQIAKLESSPRDVYCGAIGWMHNDEAAFNVAIRTSVVRDGHGVLGIGSGIVADSKVDDEFDECLLKARFLTDGIGEDDAMEETIDAGARRVGAWFAQHEPQRTTTTVAPMGSSRRCVPRGGALR